MKKSKNRISEWISIYGSKEIEIQVQKEIEHINKSNELKLKSREYCKAHKLRIEKYCVDGFVASKLIPIKAGMEVDLHTGKTISIPIRKIGSKRIYRRFVCYSDGDIVDFGIIQKSLLN